MTVFTELASIYLVGITDCRALEQTSMIYIFAVLLDLGIASKCIFPVSKLDMRSKKDQKYREKKIGIKDSRRTTACEVAFR